ncbi:AraC family transcriptional regulator [Clostridium sp.]|uniref:AraC family transcriptional regulator n=1 Tax=Clostridium sp. TaxID=1506 RepID=UPI003F3D5F64
MSSYIYFENDFVKYLEPTSSEHIDLNLSFCGIEDCEPSHSFGPAIRQHYILHYILGGKGTYHVKDNVYNLNKNQGFLICPNDLTYYEADKDDPWSYIWIAFDGIKAKKYLEYANLDSENLIFECEYSDILKSYLLDMLKIDRMKSCDELRLQGLLYLFLSTISQSQEIKNSSNNDASYKLYIEKSIEFINNNYANNIKVTDIANYVGLNRSYLTSLFKKNLDLSPQEFLLKFRMNKAFELLKHVELSIGDVSRSIGYLDPLTFSKTFKKYSGYSPKQYRENLSNDTL